MTVVGLGKLAVTVAGTPQGVVLVPTKVQMVEFTFDPADTTAVIYICDRNGNKMAALSNGDNPIIVGAAQDNPLDLATIKVDSSVNGKGPFAFYQIA